MTLGKLLLGDVCCVCGVCYTIFLGMYHVRCITSVSCCVVVVCHVEVVWHGWDKLSKEISFWDYIHITPLYYLVLSENPLCFSHFTLIRAIVVLC